jgi:hypothetical protein
MPCNGLIWCVVPDVLIVQGDGTLVAKSWNDNQPGMSPYWGTTAGPNGIGPFTLNVGAVWHA